MNAKTTHDNIRVARSRDAVYLKIDGRGCFANALIFEEFCSEMIEKDFRWFIVDLGECRGMDSTFMGVMVGLSMYLGDGKGSAISIINADEHNRELLDHLGLNRIVSVVDVPIQLPEVETEPLVDNAGSDTDRLKLVKRAHENLISVDERNAREFGPFLEALTAELKAKAH